LVTVVVLVAGVAAAITGFALTKRAVDDQNAALLREDGLQAASVIESLVADIGGTVNTVSALAAVNAPKGVIGPNTDAEIAKLATGFSVALVKPAPGGYRVAYAKGPDFVVGQSVTAPVLQAVASSGPTMSGTRVFSVGGHPALALVEGPATSGLGAVVVQFPLDPYATVKTLASGPFSNLVGAVYAETGQHPSQVVFATTYRVPVTGTTVTEPISVQGVHWSMVVRARPGVTLTGSFASAWPYFVLILVLLVTALMVITTEVLARRHRFAARQVASRTAELEASLGELRAAQEALVRSERLSAVGEMASVVGHELRNPLTAVTNSHFLLRQSLGDPAPDPVEKHLAMAERETAKAATLAEDLTAFVRPRSPVFEPVRLDEVVHEVLEATPPPSGVDVSVDTQSDVIEADRVQITEVLVNLVTNAYQAMPEGGSVTVAARATNGSASLVVADSGPGVAPDAAARLFEPFFTTKANGTGLGLAIVRRLVESHGGDVSLDNGDPGGARFTVRVPVSQGSRP